jgi:hypothetical protein
LDVGWNTSNIINSTFRRLCSRRINMKNFKNILYILLGIAISIPCGIAMAGMISIPSATGVNKILVGLSTGNWANSDLKTINGNSLIGSGDVTVTGTFATTSADYWDSTKNRWSTTSANYHFSTKLSANNTWTGTNNFTLNTGFGVASPAYSVDTNGGEIGRAHV